MITTKELADYLKIHQNTIYFYVKIGMPHYKLGKSIRYKIEEVEEWLKKINDTKEE